MPGSPRQLSFDLGVRPAFGRADFLIAPCNETAIAWLDRWPDWPGPALVIHGPAGAGKSHLAEVWRARSDAESIDTTVLAGNAPGAWREASALVIEGLGGGPIDERALLHRHNEVAERGGHLLLTAASPPARWPLALPDLASRLRLAPAVALGMPDDALLGGLMLKLFADRQITVTPDVPAYLVPRIERTFGAVVALVETLDRAALAEKRAVTVPLARAVLGERGAAARPALRRRRP